MSDEEYEKFEVTDYDLETEFQPNRFHRRQTKNQATYGVWADDSDDEGGGRGGFGGGGRRGKKERANYTSGVAFVSAGIQQPIKKEGDKKDEEDGDGEIVNDIPITDSSSEDEATLIPKAFGKKMEMELGNTAGLRTRQTHGGKAEGMYGIGARLALKMGYEPGKGLGKDLQGIAAPIEAVQRKGRGAIGAYGRETKTKPADFAIDQPPPSKPKEIKDPSWRKTEPGSSKGNRPEVRYVTVDEVLEQRTLYARPDAGKLAKTKVIDLTGPETRVLSGYHAISGQRRPQDDWEDKADSTPTGQGRLLQQQQKKQFDMPELIHNINLIVDDCEQDIMRNDRKSKHALEREAQIQNELSRLLRRVGEQNRQIESAQTLIDLIKRLTSPDISLEVALATFIKLRSAHPEEWQLFQLYNMASTVAIPLVQIRLRDWNPLQNPTDHLNLFLEWKRTLGVHEGPYHTIVWEAWMPSIRRALEFWNVKDPIPMLNLLESWRTATPSWIFMNILDQMVLPKINTGVDGWDPLSDNVPIHAWIHPWLPILGPKLEMVYPTIRRKLSNALVHWHPSDASGKQIITPWITVFTKGAMDAFVIRNIIPKLQVALDELVLTTQTQISEPWNWIMDWCDITPPKSLVQIFQMSFFPKWLQFLITWLNQRPNYEEIYRWYTWWRTLFPEILMRDPEVTENLQKALEMINASIQAPGVQMDFSYILAGRSSPAPPQPPLPGSVTVTPELMADAIRMTSHVPNGFRDLVQMKCEQLGLLFMPIPNKYYEGKQVYRCGEVAIYISANVIFIFKDGSWFPSSLNQLLQIARGSSSMYAS